MSGRSVTSFESASAPTHDQPQPQDRLQSRQQRQEQVVRRAVEKEALLWFPRVRHDGRSFKIDGPQDDAKDDVSRDDPHDEKDGEAHVCSARPAGVLEQLGELLMSYA